ncbi:helix-turn-helix domain-containing protein [Marasmitruncus massiliensis]|uniref:helix-turn-helix domain-containing protein n=1 Tax=Marasmitruncus massiliensis TaxID=1944642 RepID=UPI000C7B8C5C|nr:helix-turn-helix transcriptional regulator [Marasmitruncus massiliensis]MBE6907827.1 helix-turn-helix transcriptional regulator [Oscillospiraceae bacterium]
MSETNSILQRKEYGRIRLKLKEQLDTRGMTRNHLARRIDARFEVVNKWYNDQVEKIDTDILARICFVLDCRVEDIIEYTNSLVNRG